MVQFYRKTEIVNDTGLFQVYPDLFSGQDTTIQIKGGTANRRGVFEYVLADQPTFGDAKLTAVRPNFYINSVDLNDSTELPRYKGYVYTKHLSDLASPEGGLSIRDETAVVINSVMSNDGAWLEEKFDGTPRQIGGDVPTLEVQNGTVVRSIDRAIKVDDLIAWLGASDVTGGDGEGFWSGLVDEAEYSDDFDEYLEKGELSLKSWLCTNYGMLAGNMQATTTREQGMFQQSMMGGILPASAGAVSGMIAGSVLSVPGAVAGGVAGAIVGTMQTSPDQYHFAGKTLNFATENYIIPLKHEKRRGRKDWYRPKKDNLGPSWWIHSKDIDRSGYLLKDLKIQRETESTVDVKTMVHPGNSVFDVVRRQKSYWIADPEDYNNEIEAAYTRSRFTSSGGLDGQAAQLETHWRHIDSAEVSDRAKMIGIALDGGQTIDTRQELLMSYGHIPRPSEKDVYHAGHLDVYPEGMAKAAGDFTGYENTASRNTLIYEKLLDSKVATKVSFTLNLQDLEYAWVEPEISSTASVSPATSLDGIITSRRGFFCTLSRNPVKQSKAGQRAQTFTDYLTDNITGVIDNNTLHTNMPGTFVLGFMNFPSDTTVSSTANAEDATGYIHKERQNKVSVVWSDYWDANYSATTDTKSIGWKVSNNANEDYQGHDGVASKGYYDIQWMGLTNAIEDQPTDDIVLLDADSWYTVDMYMHPDVPCVRVHITDGSGKRVDGNNILMFAGPNAATDTMEGIRTSATASAEGYNRNSRLGDESRWPAYCSFWLNNTHWRTTNDSASAKAGYDLVGTSGAADDTNQIDILTGAAAVDGTHASSTVLLDNFNIYNINTTKTFGTISNNCIRSAVSRLTTSSYSEIEGLYKPLNHYMDMGMVNGYSYIQDPDKDGSEFSSDGVSHIFVGDGGDGYTTAPTVSIAGDGSGASATAVLGTYPESPHATIPTDRVAAVTVDAAGTGYTYAPAVSVYGGGASDNAYVRASIGTSSPTREVVKNIPAPRYMSIGLDSKPSEMYVLYGNCAAASTVTKVVGGTDYSSTSMMSFGASGATRVDHVHKLDPVAKGAGMIPALSQTNPQTAEFSSTTDNELIGGKLKIHYSDMRVGDAGCQSAVRDIVRADNGTAAPFVEVWPPLPLEPDADDDWEIQTRSHILFNDLVTREVNNVSQMLPVPYDYSRSGYDASDATATLTPSRGVFNLGWGIAMGDVPDITTTPQITPRTISGNVENAGELAQAPHGTIEGGWYDISTTLQKIAKVITQVTPNKATSVLSCVKSYDNASDHRNPSGFRRKFTSPVDLTNCDIMVICRVPAKSVASTAIQIDAEADSSGNAHLQTLFGVGPTGGGGYSEQIARGPQFAATLRLGYKDIDASLEYLPNAVGAFCAHKNLFTLGDEASVYKRTGTTGDTLNAKTLANDRWVKLVFPTADYGLSADGNKNTTNATQQYMQAISELEFGLSFEKGGVSGNEEGIVYVSGVYAIPRNAGDVMMGFSNSTNGIGEISKETFLPIAHALPPSALDGTNSVEAGLTTGSTGGKKIVGLTMGGKEKLLAGYRVNEADFGASETTITIDAMTVGTEVHIHLDDRIMLGNSSEIMRVSAINAAKTELTVERGVDGTTAATATVNNSNIYVLTPSDADVIIRDYDYDVEGFTQKGFMSLGFDENSGKTRFNEGVTWQKRENPLAATRVIEVVRHTQQGIQVKIDQPEIFQSENNTNTTWIMYRETTRGVIPDGSNNGASSTFTFNKKQLNGDVLYSFKSYSSWLIEKRIKKIESILKD